jgi:serine phosphatase RsbU (regulator of sigma subunit)
LYREVTKNLNQKKVKIMYLRIFLFLFLIFLSPITQSQNTIADSILNIASKTKDNKIKVDCYNALFLQFEYSDTIKAHNYLEKAQKIAIQNNYFNGLAENYLYYGYFEEDKGNTTGSLSFYKKSLSICQNNGLDKKIAQVKTAIGNSYFQKGDYPLALKNYLYALRFQSKENNEKGMASSYGNIGMVHSNLNDFKEAKKYYTLAINLHKKTDNKVGITTITQNLGNLYAQNKKYNKAFEYFNEALILSKQQNDVPAMANIYSSMGMAKALTGNYEEAQKNYANSLIYLEQYGNQNGIAVINCNLGEVFTELKQYNKAHSFLEKSIMIAKSNGNRECLKNAYIALTKLDSLTGNFKGAFLNHRNFIAYRDSLNNEKIQADAKASLLEFEYEKKQAIAKAEHEKEIENERVLAEETNRKQNIIILFVTIGLITLLVFVLIISFSLKKTKIQNRIIESQKIEVEVKNKEITDSINYAKRIQMAILPPNKFVKELLPESFIVYKPKDIVAGDFYWLEDVEGCIMLAACDCTGHGVPGAMVSVVCNNGLNRSLREYKLSDPGKLLDKTREIVIQEFEKSEEDVKDGMDVSLCLLDVKNLNLSWAGANNPLWIIRPSTSLGTFEIIELKPDKQPIGKYAYPKPFTTQNLKLMKGDSIYLFTDGFVDQFGGEKSKKYKTPNFKNLLISIQNKSMDEQKSIIEMEFEKWRGDLEQIDDVCIIGVKI